MHDRNSIRVGPPKPRQSRKHTARSKTGCLTCRKRRVKCDETGPPCKKCIVLQLECMYQDPSHVPNAHHTALGSLSRSGPDWRHGPASVEATRQEVRIFDLLRNALVSQIGGPIDGPFWTYDILQTAQAYPSIWHSCLGITAMFDQANNQVTNSSFVLEQYSKSLSYMQQQISKHQGARPAYSEQGSLLMSSLLLGGLCRLMLMWPEALTHSQHAAQVYHQWGYRLKALQEHDSERGPIRGKYINAMMATVELQLFPRMSNECKAGWAGHLDIAPCPDVPHKNTTDIFYELQPLYTGFQRNQMPPLYGMHSGSSRLSQSIQVLCRELSRWQEKFARFQESRYYHPNSPEGIILDMHDGRRVPRSCTMAYPRLRLPPVTRIFIITNKQNG